MDAVSAPGTELGFPSLVSIIIWQQLAITTRHRRRRQQTAMVATRTQAKQQQHRPAHRLPRQPCRPPGHPSVAHGFGRRVIGTPPGTPWLHLHTRGYIYIHKAHEASSITIWPFLQRTHALSRVPLHWRHTRRPQAPVDITPSPPVVDSPCSSGTRYQSPTADESSLCNTHSRMVAQGAPPLRRRRSALAKDSSSTGRGSPAAASRVALIDLGTKAARWTDVCGLPVTQQHGAAQGRTSVDAALLHVTASCRALSNGVANGS
ncbi:hypothetical protein PCL_04732 [Purpureocillium lilacinum]|uniref:Uncharacterized protein n=1 Tax=Purpureocillium lilacinum TaxID=33203 RepID=A0A2U3DXA3_PURLI|nr:hypothetical protein PCL_04732 [Purpureocillium lilacinum]